MGVTNGTGNITRPDAFKFFINFFLTDSIVITFIIIFLLDFLLAIAQNYYL